MSDTNIFHVMLRGINRQDIFNDEEDCIRFIEVLSECKKMSGFKLYAYCIMTNHVHLLIETDDEPLSQIFKRIGSRDVYWYNTKYNRTGHLFQDRFKSEPVEKESYFMTVLRYIIQNPLKAGMEEKVGSYRWSSYGSYLGIEDPITDTDFVMGMFQGQKNLLNFLNQQNEDKGLEMSDKVKGITDENARKIIEELTGCYSVSDYQLLDKTSQREYIKKLKGKNISLGQIARMTGIPKTTIYRILK